MAEHAIKGGEGVGQDANPCGYSFEEFKLMHDSAERVSDRKLEFNRASISLCTLIVAGQGIIIGWAYGREEIFWAAALTIIVISALGMMYCVYWLAQVNSFKRTNEAKYKVLELMAPRVAFPDYRQKDIRSSNPFDLEWKIMKHNGALTKYGEGFATGVSKLELAVPICFIFFFLLTSGLAVLAAAHAGSASPA